MVSNIINYIKLRSKLSTCDESPLQQNPKSWSQPSSAGAFLQNLSNPLVSPSGSPKSPVILMETHWNPRNISNHAKFMPNKTIFSENHPTSSHIIYIYIYIYIFPGHRPPTTAPPLSFRSPPSSPAPPPAPRRGPGAGPQAALRSAPRWRHRGSAGRRRLAAKGRPSPGTSGIKWDWQVRWIRLFSCFFPKNRWNMRSIYKDLFPFLFVEGASIEIYEISWIMGKSQATGFERHPPTANLPRGWKHGQAETNRSTRMMMGGIPDTSTWLAEKKGNGIDNLGLAPNKYLLQTSTCPKQDQQSQPPI